MFVARSALALTTCAALASCAPAEPVVQEPASIVFDAGACFGTCPSFSVTVFPDGRAVFFGHHYTAVHGERRFKISHAEYRRIAATLAPIKPQRGSIPKKPECNVGDNPSFTISWIGADGARQQLCVGDHDEISDMTSVGVRMNRAFRLLPVAEYVGPNMPAVI